MDTLRKYWVFKPQLMDTEADGYVADLANDERIDTVYLAADVERVVADNAAWGSAVREFMYWRLHYQSPEEVEREGDQFEKAVAVLNGLLQQPHPGQHLQAALAAKEARIVELEKHCKELYARTPAGIHDAEQERLNQESIDMEGT